MALRIAHLLSTSSSRVINVQNGPALFSRSVTKTSAISLRKGDFIMRKGKVWEVGKTQHVAPQQRSAIVQIELFDVVKGTKTNDRLRSNEPIDLVDVQSGKYEFIEETDEGFLFRNKDLEEITVPAQKLSDKQKAYLEEGLDVLIRSFEGKPEVINFPQKLEVVVKSLTTGGGDNMIATLENGRTVKVPNYIEEGDTIVLRVEDETFMSRV